MGSQVRVLNLDNGRSAVMRIVDRALMAGRVIDVSVEAAEALGLREAGLAHVCGLIPSLPRLLTPRLALTFRLLRLPPQGSPTGAKVAPSR